MLAFILFMISLCTHINNFKEYTVQLPKDLILKIVKIPLKLVHQFKVCLM